MNKVMKLFGRTWVRIRSALSEEYRVNYLRKNGAKIGKNVHLNSSYIDPGFLFLIEIGDNVGFSKAAVLAHDGSTQHVCQHSRVGKVKIGSNVFIGYGAIILPNVTIGDNVVIGAGSVVTHDIPANSVAAGNPCRVLDTYDSFCKKHIEAMQTHPVYDTYHDNKKWDEKHRMQAELENTWGYDK